MTVDVSASAPAPASNGPIKPAVLPATAPRAWDKPASGAAYVPSHDQFRVVFSASAEPGVESFSSKLVAERDFAPGERLASLDNASQAPVKAYSSVQYGTGPHDHLELNSDLLFMNHSCAPSAELALPHEPSRWEVRAGPAGLKQGQDITFFYPSTEWDMAQGFECTCGAETCLGLVQGAKDISLEQLEARGLVNEHIRKLKATQ